MNKKIRPALLIATLIAFQAAAAQPPGGHAKVPPLEPDPAVRPSELTAEQVIAKSNAARGGEQKLRSIRSVKMTGTWETGNFKSSPISLVLAPQRYLRRIEAAGGTMIKAVAGETTWEVTPQLKIFKPTAMHEKEAARFRRLADPQGPLVDAKAKGNKVEMVGKMPWKGSEVYKLRVTYPDGGVSYVYVDAKSFLPVRVLGTMYVGSVGRDVVLETVHRDYRTVDGVKWPFVEEATAPDVYYTHHLAWKTLEVNPAVDEAAFKMPKF